LAPSGKYSKNVDMTSNVTAGGAVGIDAYARFASMFLVGLTYEYAGLNTPDTLPSIPSGVTVNTSASSSYYGINVGIVPNVDRVSFLGEVGFGSRSVSLAVSGGSMRSGLADTSVSASSIDGVLGVGLSIPAGPIRLVPKLNVGVGKFSSTTTTARGNTVDKDVASEDRDTHVLAFIGLAAYYNLNFGAKPE
jgi:hypothetical protein